MTVQTANTGITTIANAVAATADGEWYNTNGGAPRSFQATVSGSGAVTATVEIRCSNVPSGDGDLMGTFTLSGTDTATNVFGSLYPYQYYRADVTAISGTSAAVTVLMKE